MGFSFPKGNGIKIITKESEAVFNPSGGSIYILPIDETHAKIIAVTKTGKRREIGGKILNVSDSVFENNEEALEGGLVEGNIYRTEDGTMKIVY